MEHEQKKFRLERYPDGLVRQALRYGLAAFAGFAVDYLALWLLTAVAGAHYLIATPVAFILGLVVNYLIGIICVFERGRLGRTKELCGFAAISLIALGVTELSMYAFTDCLQLHVMLSRVFSGALTYLFNFLARRRLLYRKK